MYKGIKNSSFNLIERTQNPEIGLYKNSIFVEHRDPCSPGIQIENWNCPTSNTKRHTEQTLRSQLVRENSQKDKEKDLALLQEGMKRRCPFQKYIRYALKKKKRHYLGNFPNMGGGVFPNPKTFVNLPSIFLYAKFILRC